MTIDTTIHLSDVVLVGGGIAAFLKAFLWQRDINRDVVRMLKGDDGKNGLMSDVKGLKHDVYETGGIVSKVRHTMSTIRTAMMIKGFEVPHDEH